MEISYWYFDLNFNNKWDFSYFFPLMEKSNKKIKDGKIAPRIPSCPRIFIGNTFYLFLMVCAEFGFARFLKECLCEILYSLRFCSSKKGYIIYKAYK